MKPSCSNLFKGNYHLRGQPRDAAIPREKDRSSFFRLTANVKTLRGNEPPVHASVVRDIHSAGAAADQPILTDKFHSASIAMRCLYRTDPGSAAIMGDDAIFFT